MPKVTEAHREARREEILAAAIRAFAAKGYQRTSIADVIAEAGLSAGAIYGHFDGKRDLFVAVAREMLARRDAELSHVAATSEPPSPGEALEIFLRGIKREGVALGVLLQLWGEATVDGEVRELVTESVLGVREVLRTALRAWFAAHPPEGDVEAEVESLLPVMTALGQGFVLQSAVLEEFDEERYLETVRRVLPHA